MIKILIADDQLIIAQGLKLLVSSFKDIEVIGVVKNGKEAIEFLEENQPNIVLMDITMPIMSGIEATKIITRTFPEVKVIMLTMHSEDIYSKNSKEAGAKEYILKTSPAKKLLNAIENVSNGKYWMSAPSS